MKKLIIFGLALSLGISACSYIPGFLIPDPIPTDPTKDWTYVRAFTASYGDPLCDLLPNGFGVLCRSAEDPDEVKYLVLNSGNAVKIPAELNKEVKVWIETTRPYWSLFDKDGGDLNHLATLDPTWGWSVSLLGDDVKNYLSITTYDKGSNFVLIGGIAKASWIYNEYPSIKDVPSFVMPTYSGEITIERLSLCKGEAIILVRAWGYDKDSPAPSYTGFKVIFE